VNIYDKKQRWKLILAAFAMLIVGASLWYTGMLVKRIADEEKQKVKLWAEAIEKKSKLVAYTNRLFHTISQEERKRIQLWAEANKRIIYADNNSDLTFYLDIIASNTTIPVIVVNQNGKITNWRNVDIPAENDTAALYQKLKEMKGKNPPIEIVVYGNLKNFLYYDDSRIFSELKTVLNDLIQSFISEIVVNSASVPVIVTDSSQQNITYTGNIDSTVIADSVDLHHLLAEMKTQNKPLEIFLDSQKSYVFYKDSDLLQQLKWYPFVQFFVIGLFLIISYYVFSTSRKAEQNQVWVGMAKETAHQLGTPLSSLMAWVEILKAQNTDQQTISELEKDIKRLEMITERFSKIGAIPVLKSENIVAIIEDSIQYLRGRISKNVSLDIHSEQPGILAKVNPSLFSWVLENLIKNAVDAMSGKGQITISIKDLGQYIYIDITDTGSGIPKNKQKTVFEPGFTTKKRGWGLGLSLVKRIIEDYHKGKVFVKNSSPQGTTFRIVLNK
jgi:signal transduction histidine kinase